MAGLSFPRAGGRTTSRSFSASCSVKRAGALSDGTSIISTTRGSPSTTDEQLSREPRPLPRLAIKRRPPTVFDYQYEDFEIVNYQHHAAIKAPVAV